MEEERYPILIHASLASSDVSRLLSQSKHKIRHVENTVPGTCIFPTCAVTFLILPVHQATPEWPLVGKLVEVKQEVKQNLDRLVKVHRNSFALMVSPIHGDSERHVADVIQQSYMEQGLSVFSVHNSQEAAEAMLTIAASNTKARLAEAKKEHSDWLKSVTSDDAMLNVLQLASISRHEGQVLQDGLHSLAKLVMATKDQLMDCTLDTTRADHVHDFFEKDEMMI